MELTGLSDITVSAWSIGDPAIKATMDVCVYSSLNTPAGGYGITVTQAGGFYLINGGAKIPYSLTWNDGGVGNLASSNGVTLTNGVELAGQANANTVSPLCITGPNARLGFTVNASDMTAALAGTYSGSITLLLSPN